jgi:TetR/AcrR family transcriptional regulator, transcriptional repressor for nem operon
MARACVSKDKILATAKELFYRMGYVSTSVDDIIRQSKVAKSNFYYHFQSKEDLALAVLELRVREYETVVLQSLKNENLPPTERLEQFFARFCTTHTEEAGSAGCPFGNFAAALPTLQTDESCERFRKQLSNLFCEMESSIQQCIAAGIKTGEFRPDVTASEAAVLMVAVLQGLLMLTKTHQDPRILADSLIAVKKLLQPHRNP